MIQVTNLSYSFPNKDLFHDITFSIEEGTHCAFIGASGSGKTTLAQILLQPENYLFDGTIQVDPLWRTGYVSQFSQLDQSLNLTVFEYLAQPCEAVNKKIESICTATETADDVSDLMVQYQVALDQLEALGGNDFEMMIEKQLRLAELIGLKDLPVRSLSGGEFKLIQVMKEMFAQPEFIVMDEPDVFLDFEHLNALKNLINQHKGTLLVITHNRFLLNHCFHKILHLENKELQEFDGRYLDYQYSLLTTKIELMELALADEEEIKRLENVIDRFRFIASYHSEAARGKTLHAKEKVLERLKERRVKAPFINIAQPAIHFTAPISAEEPTEEEKLCLQVNNYHLAFDDVLLQDVNFDVQKQEKIALIGPNGSGKTSLLREIFKDSNPAIKHLGEFHPGYVSQVQDEVLIENHTVMEEFMDWGIPTYTKAEEYAEKFLFPQKLLQQPVSSLSGGEKTLLQLAKLGMKEYDFLLLDEPTSHLDIYAQNALEEALKEYQGAVLMVSHDFYTTVNCMDYVLILENKTLRKMSIRKFRKMIYAKYFSKDYLELEQKKGQIEKEINLALHALDMKKAKALTETLGTIIEKL